MGGLGRKDDRGTWGICVLQFAFVVLLVGEFRWWNLKVLIFEEEMMKCLGVWRYDALIRKLFIQKREWNRNVIRKLIVNFYDFYMLKYTQYQRKILKSIYINGTDICGFCCDLNGRIYSSVTRYSFVCKRIISQWKQIYLWWLILDDSCLLLLLNHKLEFLQ